MHLQSTLRCSIKTLLRMRESQFQRHLIDRLERIFPGCMIIKVGSREIQGLPDLLILWHDHWAVLEVKQSEKAARQPNQEYYVDKLNQMSFASFISPENEGDVLHALQTAFGVDRQTRVSQS